MHDSCDSYLFLFGQNESSNGVTLSSLRNVDDALRIKISYYDCDLNLIALT